MRLRYRVWLMFQARCLDCDWAGEVHGESGPAAHDAREHRQSPEHKIQARSRS
jgi:hypothetical protein